MTVTSPFQTVMREYCEWWNRPDLNCDRWGSAMDAAFKVSDYMAESWSEYPLKYTAGLGGVGSIIDESPELEAYLDTLTREQVRRIALTIERYTRQLKHAKLDY